MTFTTNISGIISTDNSTTSLLIANATFTGTGVACQKYSSITINIESDVDSAAGGVSIQFSSDNSNWVTYNEYTYMNTCNFNKTVIISAAYCRIVYVNGATGQSSFRLQTLFHISKPPVNTPQTIAMASDLTDAFGRLRVSNPTNLIEITHVNGLNDQRETRSTSGTGAITMNANAPIQNMSVTTNLDSAISQSRVRGYYQPGKSTQIFITGVLNQDTNGSGVSARLGFYDDDDGIYFEHRGDGADGSMYVVLRTSSSGSVVNTEVEQDDWNIDKMDGSGPSGVTMDPSKTLIYTIDFEWLGVGKVRTGLVINGTFFYVHDFLNSNIQVLPYMNLATQPLRAEIVSTSGAGEMGYICSTAISEGGLMQTSGDQYCVTRGNNLETVTTTLEPIISIRLKSTRLKTQVLLTKIHAIVTSGGNLAWYLYLFRDTTTAAQLTGASWVSAHSDSAAEYDITATAVTLTNTQLVSMGYISNNTDFLDFETQSVSNTNMTSNLNGETDFYVFAMQTLGGGNESISASLEWKEII